MSDTELAEIEAMVKAVPALIASLRAARVENERLTTALELYADPESYTAIAFFFDEPCGSFAHDFGDDHGHVCYDRPMPGKAARAALKSE